MSDSLKTPITDEERVKLAEKLDKDVEDFIGTLEKKPYRDGFNPEKLDEEMQAHPAFRTQPFGADEKLPPLVEAMQQLKYDPNENTPAELAKNYKDDGNYNFKLKKYRWAIDSYTEGIKQECGDAEVCAQLYTNRAASHFHLGNFRSSLADCESAVRHKPDHLKAIVRAVQCCQKLLRYEEVVSWCNKVLEIKPDDSHHLEQKYKAEQSKILELRNRRKDALTTKKEHMKIAKLTQEIKARGIRLVGSLGHDDGSDTKIIEGANSPVTAMVHENESGGLSWPVTFLYPEYGQTDMIQSFDENDSLDDHLRTIFAERPPWDSDAKYSPDRLQIYFEENSSVLCAVSPDAILGRVLQDPRKTVYCGLVHFYVTVKNSAYDQHFLKQYKKVVHVKGK